jgi:predicted enzyme related to lactoylglutathione lyase
MVYNNPIFADLSTYSPKETMPFHENVFGWSYYESYGYYTAYLNSKQVSGLYETPDKFKQMRMPHFWMTYISVNSVDETVAIAQSIGGIIEMQEHIDGFGKVALRRAPLGAGFTVYEGNVLQSTRTENTANTLVWNELHVSDIHKVIPFYESIFNWSFEMNDQGTAHVYNEATEPIANIMTIPNSMKGKYEYWISSFAVTNLKESLNLVIQNGGSVVFDEGHRILVTDNSRQAFFYITEL